MIKHWTKNEITLLEKHYPTTLVRDLVSMFPKRNKATIVAKALSLRLPSAKLWQPEENEILHKHFSSLPADELLKLLPQRSKTAIWAQGERLGLKQDRNRPRVSVNENYFKTWSFEMAYILGFILSDGCIIQGTYKGYSDALKFGVQKKDVDILEKIKKELSSNHKISPSRNAFHFCITSQIMVDDLKKLGINYRKSLKEKIPNVPPKYTKDFIRGIVDGDGSIHFDKNGYPTISICGGRKTMSFIKKHFLNLSAYSKITSVKKYEDGQPLFYVAYRGSTAKILIKYLYQDANLYLERKFKSANRALAREIKQRKNHGIINYS